MFILWKEQNEEPEYLIEKHRIDLDELEEALATMVYLSTMYEGFDFETQDLEEEDRDE